MSKQFTFQSDVPVCHDTLSLFDDAPSSSSDENLNPNGIHWLSTQRRVPSRLFAPEPIRGRQAWRAAREAAAFIGEPVLIWSDDGRILWVERPEVRRRTGRRLTGFVFVRGES